MPQTRIVLYREADGRVPVLDWLDGLPEKSRDKVVTKLRRLRELGHELRRPEADLLRNGIYELRIDLHRIHYRVLYFFDGTAAAVVSHGLTKERIVPPVEIDRAIQRKFAYLANRILHSAELNDV